VVVQGGRPNSVRGLSFGCSCGRTIADELNFLLRHSNTASINNVKDTKTHHTKIYPPLPVVVGKAVVWGVTPNLVCGLIFGPFHGRTIDDELKKNSDIGMKHL
jgi:hypothetical protein